jgi:DNA polymerase III sliding clamp (beta) subunit (PCNA family)
MSDRQIVAIPYAKFAKALRLLVPQAQKNINNPNLLLVVNRSEMSVECTNGNILLSHRIGVESNFTGQIVLPPRILRALQAETGGAVLIMPGEDNTVEVRIGEDIWVFPTEDPGDYPMVNWSSGIDGSIPADKFLEAIKFVEHAIDRGNGSSKYALCGVCLEIHWGSKIWVQATDSRRLAFTQVELADEAEESKTGKKTVVIPAANLPTLKALCSLDDRIELVENGDQLQFRAGSLIVISKLMEGRFPAVRGTAIKATPFAAVASDQLAQAVQVAAVCVDPETSGVEVEFRLPPTQSETAEGDGDLPPTVVVSCTSTLGRSTGTGWCLAVHEPRQLTMKPEYISEALKNLEENTRCELRSNEDGTLQIDCAIGTMIIAGMST